MTDLDPRASRIDELHFSRFSVEARQLIFHCLQRFEHLDSEKVRSAPEPRSTSTFPTLMTLPMCQRFVSGLPVMTVPPAVEI
jgi:hypothetical protein